jgi:hypothetical protein
MTESTRGARVRSRPPSTGWPEGRTMTEPTDRILHVRDLPGLYELDLLGRGEPSLLAGNSVLAELLCRTDDVVARDAAASVEFDQLHQVTEPADNLSQVIEKLAVAVRLAHWALDENESTYAAVLFRLISSALADVITLRAAEHTLRRELARAAEKATGNPLPEEEAGHV